MAEILVEVCKINKIIDHPNADRLEIAVIKGWNCIVGKEEWKTGDICVFIPPNSVIPDNLIDKYELEHLRSGGKRVGTVKLRGFVSQGLVLPVPEGNYKIGDNVAKDMKITKWMPKTEIYQTNNKKRKNNPYFDKYTDINHIQHYNEIFKLGDTVVISEKIHGTNARYGNLPIYTDYKNPFKKIWAKIKKMFSNKYEFVYGSHNIQITKENSSKNWYKKNIYGQIAEKYNMKNIVPKDYIIYGEIYGKGVQDLTYGLKNIDLVVFDIKYKDQYLPYDEVFKFCKEKNLPMVPLLYKGLWKEGLVEKCTIGNSTICPKQIREGCVIKDYFENNHPRCGRKILKSLNDNYLLRKNGTEYH
jgi:RNA ligase (TIGR02306 family)